MYSYISVILGWTLLFIVLYGIGDITTYLIKRFFKISFNTVVYKVLIGFCITLLLLGLIHLFSPITGIVLIFFLIISSVSFGTLILKIIRKERKRSVVANYPLILISIGVIFLVLIIINQTFITTFVYDQGFYYMQILKWYEQYPIVLGLANIHGRFGFNNSTFLLFSLFDSTDLLPYDSNWVNTGLSLFTILFSLWNMYKVVKSKTYDISKIFLGFLWLPICIALFSNNSKYLVSMSPDNYVFFLEMIIVGILISFRNISNREFKKKFFLILILSSTLFSIKLSGALFGVGSVLLVLSLGLRRFGFKNIIKYSWFWLGILTATVVVVVTLLRSFLLSGYPFYPSTILDVNPKWSVTKEVADNELCFVKSWAREHNSKCESVLDNNDWIDSWSRGLRRESVWPYMMIISFLLTGFLIIKKKARDLEIIGVYLILITSLIYWFLLAPDLRFALGIFWSFILLSGSILISEYRNLVWYSLFMDLIILVVLASNITLRNISIEDVKWDRGKAKLEQESRDTDSGVRIHMPVKGVECWDQEVPCTPYFDSRLELLDKQKGLRGGFYVDRE